MPDDSLRLDPDSDLVRRAQHGDTAAFDTLVVRYRDALYPLIFKMTANAEDADDLLQEVFAKAFRSICQFRGAASFQNWIYQIAVNTTCNFMEKTEQRDRRSQSELDPKVIEGTEVVDQGCDSNPAHQMSVRELQKGLSEAIQHLSESHRGVVTLFDLHGLPHAEIARRLMVSEGTVRSRLHYAHRHLQSHLQDFWDTKA